MSAAEPRRPGPAPPPGPAQSPPAWPAPSLPQMQPQPAPGWGQPSRPTGGPWPAPGPQPHHQQGWPAPDAGRGPGGGAGVPADDPRPGVPTLIGVTLWRLGIAGAAYYFATDEGGVAMADESLSKLSNLGVAWGYLGLALYPALVAGRRHEPRTGWLRGALTIMMLLVFFVFVPGMGEEPDGPHAVIPAVVLIDWLFVGRNQFRTRAWEPPTWTAFLLAYLFYHQSNDLPLYEEILGEENIGTMVPLLLAGSVAVAYLLFGASMLRRATSRSGSTR